MRDQHFSIVGRYLKNAQFSKRLTNIHEICDILNAYQKESESKKSVGNRIVKHKIAKNFTFLAKVYKAEIMPSKDETVLIGKLSIDAVQSLYNITSVVQDDKIRLFSTAFSDLKDMIEISKYQEKSA